MRRAFSLWPPLQQAAAAFCPPYEVSEERKGLLSILLADPEGQLPDLRAGYRLERRLFVRTAYLALSAEFPGQGPPGDADFRARKPARTMGPGRKLRWDRVAGELQEWRNRVAAIVEGPAARISSVESLTLGWHRRGQGWRFRLETLSGSVVAGMLPPVPIPVPIEPEEVAAVVAMLTGLRRALGA